MVLLNCCIWQMPTSAATSFRGLVVSRRRFRVCETRRSSRKRSGPTQYSSRNKRLRWFCETCNLSFLPDLRN